MRNFIFICLLLISGLAASAQSKYDKAMADSLGADPYGMKNYFFVILKSGYVDSAPKEVLDSLFNGHMKNIQRLAKEKKLVLAGPFGNNSKNYRGIFIFNGKKEEEIRELLKTDPAISYGLLDTEIYPWYGSAALQLVVPNHEKIQKEHF